LGLKVAVNQVSYKNVLTTLRERATKTRQVEECLMDSSQHASTQRATCEEAFGEKHSSDGTSNLLSGTSTVRLFPPENQVCAQRKQVSVRGCSESKSDATLEQDNAT